MKFCKKWALGVKRFIYKFENQPSTCLQKRVAFSQWSDWFAHFNCGLYARLSGPLLSYNYASFANGQKTIQRQNGKPNKL